MSKFSLPVKACLLAAAATGLAGITIANSALGQSMQSIGTAECAAITGEHFANDPSNVTTRWIEANSEKVSDKAESFLPAHCVVEGTINPRVGVDGVDYGIRFQLRMPANWNGRFFFQGGGGFDGSLRDAFGTISSGLPADYVALNEGYAVVSTDGGHDNSKLENIVAFALDPQARIDYGYNAIDKTAGTAKSIIQSVYGQDADYSYFVGCSNGGRQGLIFSQRFPDYFDGIVGGSPVMDLAAIAISNTYGLQVMANISPTGEDGTPQQYNSIGPAEQALFRDAYMAQCDSTDGIVDGMVQNPLACRFNLSALQCTGEKTDSCLSSDQILAIKAVVGGATTSDGLPLRYPGYFATAERTMVGYPLDPGWMTATGQVSRLIGTQERPVGIGLGPLALSYLHFEQPDPDFDPLSADWDTVPERMTVNAPWLATNPDISGFKAYGGKMMLYNGTTDPGPLYLNTINYFDQVAELNGGIEATKDFLRVYMVPGMGHCGGGPSTDSFDLFKPMVDWVEHGIAPDNIVASSRAANAALSQVSPAIPPDRTRPLCAYPQSAVYNGTGDPEDAASFVCQ